METGSHHGTVSESPHSPVRRIPSKVCQRLAGNSANKNSEVITVVDNISGASTTETFIDVENDNDDYTYGSTDVDEIWKITESKNKSLKAEFTEDYTSSSSSSNASTFDGLTITTTSTGTSTVTGTGTIEMTQE